MDKGIFYLVCTVVLLIANALMGIVVNEHTSAVCKPTVVYKERIVTTTPTPTPDFIVHKTATKSAVVK